MPNFRNILFPVVDREVQERIDKESLVNIHRLSLAGMAFMLIALVLFVPSMGQFDQTSWARIGKFICGFFICLVGFVVGGRIKESNRVSHRTIAALIIAYAIALSLWAIFVSYREYLRGEQLLIFFSVELLIVCFVPLRPIVGTLLTIGVYSCLYAVAFSIDGAQGLLIRNLLTIVVVTITGMVVNYHSQIRLSKRAVHLERVNDQLEFSNRHDALTRLRNRKALQEDVAETLGNWVAIRMIDVNDFKAINDTYGHLVGDAVLEEAGRQIKRLFPEARCYRYGGDEFIALSNDEDCSSETELRFSVPSLRGEGVSLSIGCAEGTPQTEDELFKLIAIADAKLYEIKRKIKRSHRAPNEVAYD